VAYLAGHDPPAVAQLLKSPDQQNEPGLHAMIMAFDSLIAAARASILSEDINVFALHRVNSFLRGRPYSKPLHTKLLDGTFRNYRAVWHKLLCFTYRLVVLRQGPRLHFKLTPAQLHAFSQVSTQKNCSKFTQSISSPAANAALGNSPHHLSGYSVSPELQNVCLQLCLSLLDHKLHGKLSDSIVIGFLAALGINRERSGLDGAAIYTPKLSGFVKLAQLLVIQHAVIEHRSGRVVFPNELVAELQDRFMVFGSDTPMNWILNLRAYGKKERDNTTSAGHIVWSDDGAQLAYRTLELTMNGLRWFLRDQVELAQISSMICSCFLQGRQICVNGMYRPCSSQRSKTTRQSENPVIVFYVRPGTNTSLEITSATFFIRSAAAQLLHGASSLTLIH
jgi:hypothetical protein